MSKLKIGAIAGIATPVLAFSCILGAIATYPQFSWTDNALSDLGVVWGTTASLFNIGLSVSGVMGIIFALLGLYIYMGGHRLGRIGAGFFAAATVALLCIGIFNESIRPIHYIVSVAFFSLAPIALFILTYTLYISGRRGLATFSVVAGLVAGIPWILQLTINYVPKVAIPEFISAVAISVWAVTLSVQMLRQRAST